MSIRDRLLAANVEHATPNQRTLRMRESDIDWILDQIAAEGFAIADLRTHKIISKDLMCVHMDTLMRTPIRKRKP